MVLPQDPEVFLVDADRVGDRLGVAGRICDHAVEVANLAQAVTAEHQRVRRLAHAALAGIEVVAPVEAVMRISVRNDHLAETGSIQDRTIAPLVVVGDGMEHQSLERLQARPQAPPLPGDQVALDLEARALGLDDRQRLQV